MFKSYCTVLVLFLAASAKPSTDSKWDLKDLQNQFASVEQPLFQNSPDLFDIYSLIFGFARSFFTQYQINEDPGCFTSMIVVGNQISGYHAYLPISVVSSIFFLLNTVFLVINTKNALTFCIAEFPPSDIFALDWTDMEVFPMVEVRNYILTLIATDWRSDRTEIIQHRNRSAERCSKLHDWKLLLFWCWIFKLHLRHYVLDSQALSSIKTKRQFEE